MPKIEDFLARGVHFHTVFQLCKKKLCIFTTIFMVNNYFNTNLVKIQQQITINFSLHYIHVSKIYTSKFY